MYKHLIQEWTGIHTPAQPPSSILIFSP